MHKYCKWCDQLIMCDADIVLTDDEHEDVCCSGECAVLQEEENALDDLGQL